MKDTTITFRVPEEEKLRLKEMAKGLDVPISQLIRVALKEYFKNQENK